MTINRGRRVLLLALLLATAAAVLSYQLIASRPLPAPAVVEVTPETGEPVLVAASPLLTGTVLTASDVKVVYVAAGVKAERVLTGSEQAIGKVALADIPEGEQILAGSVGDATAAADDTFAQQVPVGMRAVTIATEETVGVGGLVQPGDRVDVIAAFELKPVRPSVGMDDAAASDAPAGDPFPVAELILQDVAVLAVGQALDATELAAAPAADPETEADPAASVVGPVARPEATSATLLVNPAEALRLLLAVQAGGDFRLLLRAPGDTSVTELPPALITDGSVDVEPFHLIGSNLVPEGLAITSARFEQASVPAGGILEFEVTVRNVSSRLIPAGGGGANSGHVYSQHDSWETIGEPGRPGVFSLGLMSETAGQITYPWRWDLGQDLEPGQSATITGGIQAPNQPGVHRWWFGTVIQPGTVVEDGIGVTEITVEPVESVVVRVDEIDLRQSPWPDAAVVTTAPLGTRADVLEYRDGWFLIRAGEDEGWVAEAFVVNSALPAATQFLDAAQGGQEDTK